MQYTLTYNDSAISSEDRRISQLRFAEDIYLSAGYLMKYTNSDSIAKKLSRYGMELSNENSIMLVNDPDPNKGNSNYLIINMYEKKLE